MKFWRWFSREEGLKAVHVWKEVLEVWDGGDRLGLACMNVAVPAPFPLYFPTQQLWERAAPEWARGRREEILAFLSKRADLKIYVTDDADFL